MDRGQTSSLMDRHQAAITDITKHFSELIIGLASPVTAEDADTATAAQQAMRMQLETKALITATENLLSLTRQIRELWLVGPLLKPSEGERAADGQIGDHVEAITRMLNEMRERDRKLQVGPHGTYIIKDRASGSAATDEVEADAVAAVAELASGDADLFLALLGELTRSPSKSPERPGAAVKVDMDEIRMMEDAFDLLPLYPVDGDNPEAEGDLSMWGIVGEQQNNVDPVNAAQTAGAVVSNVPKIFAQDVVAAQVPLPVPEEVGGAVQDHHRGALRPIEGYHQSNEQRDGDGLSDTIMVDGHSGPVAISVGEVLNQDHGLVDELLPLIFPSGLAHDAEVLDGTSSKMKQD